MVLPAAPRALGRPAQRHIGRRPVARPRGPASSSPAAAVSTSHGGGRHPGALDHPVPAANVPGADAGAAPFACGGAGQLADGNNRTGSIAQAVELNERQVYNLLKELENDFGLVPGDRGAGPVCADRGQQCCLSQICWTNRAKPLSWGRR